MRAGRLVNLLLVLQRRGRVTAATLADELGVSVRTVLRDVQALHEAGIPVVTGQGAGGGIDLVAGFRTVLTGLTAEEAAAVLLIGQPALARLLGLAAPVDSARRKILVAVAPDGQRRAAELDAWFLLDPYGWGDSFGRAPEAPAMLARLATATRRLLVSQLGFAAEVLEVLPLALVTKAGSWYLVHLLTDGPAALDLEGLEFVRLTQARFVRPADFDLASTWEALSRGLEP